MAEYYPTPATTGRATKESVRAFTGPRSLDVTDVVTLTQAAYDALSPADPQTLYIVVG